MRARSPLALLVLVACGQVDRNPRNATPSAGSDAGAAAGAGVGGSLANAAGAGSGAAGTGATTSGGGAGGPDQLEPPLDISGRWAMFVFEDPVGVQILQDGGAISGHGCAAGTPPLVGEVIDACGDLSGKVTGNRAAFGFTFDFVGVNHYMADVVVSADAQRMTGSFQAVAPLSTPTAWLRVPDEQQYLPLDPELLSSSEHLRGRYRLRLLESATGGEEYEADRDYTLGYLDRGLYGDLGSFWQSELSEPEPGVLRAGPVAPTAPALAVTLTLESKDGSPARVTARTGSGNEYVFSASLDAPGL